ncbi:MAG TPA: hypothetical protein VM781_01525 [Candidatus Bathyarchaeia archaeon]|nr:hypothetical protein [Candidatus Bathyarchaeia archaeon]
MSVSDQRPWEEPPPCEPPPPPDGWLGAEEWLGGAEYDRDGADGALARGGAE